MVRRAGGDGGQNIQGLAPEPWRRWPRLAGVALVTLALGFCLAPPEARSEASPSPQPTPVSSSPLPSPTPAPGQITLWLPGDTPLFLAPIPAGSFAMGSMGAVNGQGTDQRPVHDVTLTRHYHMGQYAVTKRQWTAVMGTAPWSGQEYVLDHPDSPATHVSWEDIAGPEGFLDQVNRYLAETDQAGAGRLRLPTEAEWEHACRAGTTTRFYWGDDPGFQQIDAFAWYEWNAFMERHHFAHVVGQKRPNAWGLYDMSGNVWEWCQDWYGPYTAAPAIDPAGPDEGASRVLRGGSWISIPLLSRSSWRIRANPTSAGGALGFRVAATSPESWIPATPAPLPTPTPSPSSAPSTMADMTLHLPGDVSLTLVPIPAGSFQMGAPLQEERWQWMEMPRHPDSTRRQPDPNAERQQHETEGPVHTVTLTRDFHLGQHTVTKAQWTAVMGTTPWADKDWVLDHPDSPAVYVSWDDITGPDGFLERLNAHLALTGQAAAHQVCLPTEAQWEYACRAGTTTRFYWGLDPDSVRIVDCAWHEGAQEGEYAHVVGRKRPNPWGLYDMSGNVWEWCRDRYRPYSQEPQRDPVGPTDSWWRPVLRGGAWHSSPYNCRSAHRHSGYTNAREAWVGFRIAVCPGTLVIEVAPAHAGWKLTGPGAFAEITATGTTTIVGAPAGLYAIDWLPLAGHVAPVSISAQTLAPDGVTTFTGQYAQTSLGEAITLMLPGDTPLEMVPIPAGLFRMGPSNHPHHKHTPPVTLTRDFYMGKYPVTQRQWNALMDRAPWTNWARESPDNPAVHMTWAAITGPDGFMARLNAHLADTGQDIEVRLPTQAEWEYACRAGTTTRFYWGDDPDLMQIDEYAWYDENSRPITQGWGPLAVGQKRPNAWGLYDMIGNVWEFCLDGEWERSAEPVTDPMGPPVSEFGVLRGGSWNKPAEMCGSAYEYLFVTAPDGGSPDQGFRLVAPR